MELWCRFPTLSVIFAAHSAAHSQVLPLWNQPAIKDCDINGANSVRATPPATQEICGCLPIVHSKGNTVSFGTQPLITTTVPIQLSLLSGGLWILGWHLTWGLGSFYCAYVPGKATDISCVYVPGREGNRHILCLCSREGRTQTSLVFMWQRRNATNLDPGVNVNQGHSN